MRLPRRSYPGILSLIFILSASLLVLRSQNTDTTALGILALSMRPGTWAELQTTDINVVFSSADMGGGASGTINHYSDKAAWDTVSKRIFFLGGDHNWEIPFTLKFASYSASTNSWQKLAQPSWTAGVMHGYSHSAIDPVNRRLYHRPYGQAIVQRYNLETATWSSLPAIPTSVMEYRAVSSGVTWFPERNSLIYTSVENGINGSVAEYSETTGAWRRIGPGKNLPMGDPHVFAQYNPVHKVVFFGGGGGEGKRIYRLDSAGNITALKDAPENLGMTASVITVDTVTGDFLVLTSSKTFYKYNILTDAWQVQPGSLPGALWSVSWKNPVAGVIATPVDYGATLFVTCDSGPACRVHLYKSSAGAPASSDPTPPVPGPVPSSNFATRCAAAGVLKCVGFDQAADLIGTYGDNSGSAPGQAAPQLDSAVKASGNSALKFTIPSNSAANTSGSYFTNFSDDLSAQFGANSEFFVQWRQRFSPEFAATAYEGGGGWKQAIIGTGDKPGCTSSNSSSCYASCTALEVVTQNNNHRGFAQMYNSCTGSASHGAYQGFEEPVGSDFKLQNARPAPYCLYSQGPASAFPPKGNCIGYFPNEWMTFQVRIKTGPRVNDEFTNSYVELWIAREGRPSQQAINWGPYNLTAGPAAENQRFGKVWLLPYNTNKSSAQSHPAGYTWYDELIVSRSRIADPEGVTAPPPVDTNPPALSSIVTDGITAGGALIHWTTDEAADSQIEFGPSASYGNQSPLNTSLVTSHAQSLSGLSAATTYNFRVKSRDASGNLAISANLTFTTASSPASVPRGFLPNPIGYWNFEEGTGSTAADSSGGNFHGTLTNGVTWTAGKIGSGALRFNATDNGNDADDPRLLIGTALDVAVPWTLTVWVNPADYTDWRSIFSKRSSPDPSNLRFEVGLSQTTGNVYVAAGRLSVFPYTPPSNVWTHLAVVGSSTQTLLYVNGALQATLGAVTMGTNGLARVAIGGTGEEGSGADNDPFKGELDDVRLYNQALSSADVLAAYDFTGPVNSDGGPAIYSLSPDSGEVWTPPGTSNQVEVGFVQMEPAAGSVTPTGVAIISNMSGGVLIGEAAVPPSLPIQAGRFYAGVSGGINTGVAMANTGNAMAAVEFSFTDANGDFGFGSLTLGAGQQIAKFMTEAPFNVHGRSFIEGSFSFASSVPLAVVALRGFTNERGEFLFSTLPVAPIEPGFADAGVNGTPPGAAGANGRVQVLPHFVNGGGWTTQVILTNISEGPVKGSVEFYDSGSATRDGGPAQLQVNDSAGSTFGYQIPARSTVRLATSGQGTLQVGSVRVIPSGDTASPLAVAIFSLQANGFVVTEASVSAVPLASAYRMYLESSGVSGPGLLSSHSATAIANTSIAPLVVRFELKRLEDGAAAGFRTSITVPAGGQVARFINELFPELASGFRGTLRLSADSPFAMTGLQGIYNQRGDFLIVSIPPTEDPPPALRGAVFPHIVSGSGYSTRVILYTGPAGASGSLLYTTQDGQPRPAGFLHKLP